MNENEMQQEDEVSLFDLWETLREGWKSVAGGAALGLAGAVVATVLIAPKYEAVALLRVGSVAGNVIEAPELSVQRVGAPAFRLELARKSGDETLLDAMLVDATANKDFATATMVKGVPLIALKTTANSRELALTGVNVLLALLEARHTELGATLRSKVESDITMSKEKLKVIERELVDLEKLASNSSQVKDTQFASVSLLTSLRVQKQAEIFGLRQQLTALELSLLPPATQPTHAIEAPYVANKPVSPKRGLLLALGAIGGLLFGVMWVFVANAWRRARKDK